MKAVRYHETGEVDILRWEDAPDPQPGPNDV
jgi:NADPH:quinone reductase-like Zn-dependent oxidoreductase